MPLQQVRSNIELFATGIDRGIKKGSDHSIVEFKELDEFVTKSIEAIEAKHAAEKELVTTAAQVAHDIRSPLSALDTIVSSIQDKIPEQERIMMRTAFRRINNIANDLVAKYKGREHSPDTLVFIYVAMKDIVSEKDLEYSHKNIRFELVLDEPNSAFLLTEGNYKEMRRMLSNLINNAVNVMPEGGVIQVLCYRTSEGVLIRICDQGAGMSEERIEKLLSEQGAKEAGIGLGLHHAKEYMKKYGGGFLISSQIGRGTTVALSFKTVERPKWLAEKLKIKAGQNVTVIDDDASIHDIWTKKFEGEDINRVDFYTPQDARVWLKEGGVPDLVLCDYEFLGQAENGLDFLESIQHVPCVKYLVTTHVDDEAILNRCESLGLQLIPKHLLPYVCIGNAAAQQAKKDKVDVPATESSIDAVFIDDDAYNHEFWQYAAKKKKKALLCFASSDAFLNAEAEIALNTPIYIDLNLGDENGLEVAQKLKDKGFTTLYIATGFADFDEKAYPWLAGVIGKEPPF